MPLNIRSEDGNQLAERLAARTRVAKTEAVRTALVNELRRVETAVPLRERIRGIQARVLARPATGLEVDKVFYDALSDDAMRPTPLRPPRWTHFPVTARAAATRRN
jgi:antitoxin VapB